jgi:hypothetical protein
LHGQQAVGQRTSVSTQALALVLQPMIERGVDPREIIDERPLKQLQAFGSGNRCCRQHTSINPEPIIQQQEMIAVGQQQRSGA